MSVTIESLVCRICNCAKSCLEFYPRKSKLTGIVRYSKVCRGCYSTTTRRNTVLKYYHNITLEQFEEMYFKQNGKCAICNGSPVGKVNFDVDHCHATGKIRGLLCMNCNHIIGKAKDDIKILNSAIVYLLKNK